MKLCYIDETGTDGRSPVIVFVGVVVDGVRSSTTRDELDRVFEEASLVLGKAPSEIKGSDLYQKKKVWRNLEGSERHAIFGRLCELVISRKHDIALSVLDVEKTKAEPLDPTFSNWTAGALHVALQIQRGYQRQERNKGHSLLIFDNHRDSEQLISNVLSPPNWTDAYYARGKKQSALDAIIDAPLFADSKHIGLLQVADVLAFMFRRHIELNDFGLNEDFDGERSQLAGVVERVEKRLIEKAHRYPKLPTDHVANWYRNQAPGYALK